MTVFLVTYTDDEGPYAVAFSSRAMADRYACMLRCWGDVTVVDAVVDQHADIPMAELDANSRVVFYQS